MKKLILFAALIVISLGSNLYAQNGYYDGVVKAMNTSKEELTFNAKEGLINVRAFVVLKQGRMILDLSDLKDYESFRNIDSLLQEFLKDIAFYKDSLSKNPTGNVRIDYVLNSEYTFKKIRFKLYQPESKIFLNRDGEISKLKFAQDTVRLVIEKSKPGISRSKVAPCMIPYSIQVTFLLDNYYDIQRIVAEGALQGIIDTLEKKSHNKKTDKSIYSHPVTLKYNPYYSGKNLNVYNNILMNNEYLPRPWSRRPFEMNINLGAGLVRSNVASYSEIGIQYNNYTDKTNRDRDVFRLSLSAFTFFDKNAAGEHILNGNAFINISIGSIYENNSANWLGDAAVFGIGYLVVNNGGYYKNTTFRSFTDFMIKPKFTISPELTFTDNFKQIFTGITLKFF